MGQQPQKIFFGRNIKFLRERRKMSQESLAAQLGITRAKLAAIESGQTKAPQPEDYVGFSDCFAISVDSLLKVDLSKLGELKLRELEAGNDVYMAGTKIRVLAITVDKKNKENLEYVPVKAKAGYRAGYHDPQFIKELPKFSFPGLPRDGTFRMFPITGDSMLPVPDGSDVIGQYVVDWTGLKPDTPCIVILNGEQDVVFKLVTVRNDGTVQLRSLNSLYEPFTVPAEDILEVWKFFSFTTRTLPEGGGEIMQVAGMIREMRRDIQALKENRGK